MANLWLIICSLLFLVGPLLRNCTPGKQSSAAGRPQSNQSPSAVLREIPFDLVSTGHILLEVRVNGKPGWFILDSANHGITLDFEFARRAGVEIQQGYIASGGGSDSIEAGRASNVAIELSGIVLSNSSVTAIMLKPMEPALGRSFDGILGSDLFTRYVVEVDYSNKVIRLYDSATYRSGGKGEVIRLEVDQDSLPFIRVGVTMPEKQVAEGKFLIDSAAAFVAVLLKSFTESHNLISPSLRTYEDAGLSTGGGISFLATRAEQVKVGSFALSNPVILISQDRKGSMSQRNYDGLIGGDFLRRFKVVFDYGHQQMVLEPNASLNDPVDDDCSGLRMRAEGNDFRTIKVTRIIKNSPAADAKLQRGDILTSINGQPAGRLTLEKVREMLKDCGKEYELEVARGNQLRRVRLGLRPLF